MAMTRRRPKDPPTDPAIVATRLVRADTRSLSVPGVVVADELVELTDELDTEVTISVVSTTPLPEVDCDESGMDGAVTDVLEPFCEFVDGDSIAVVLDGSDCVLDTLDDTEDGEDGEDEEDVEDIEAREDGREGGLDESDDPACDVTVVDWVVSPD